MVICLERGADLHMVQLMPLPRFIICANWLIQIYNTMSFTISYLIISWRQSHKNPTTETKA